MLQDFFPMMECYITAFTFFASMRPRESSPRPYSTFDPGLKSSNWLLHSAACTKRSGRLFPKESSALLMNPYPRIVTDFTTPIYRASFVGGIRDTMVIHVQAYCLHPHLRDRRIVLLAPFDSRETARHRRTRILDGLEECALARLRTSPASHFPATHNDFIGVIAGVIVDHVHGNHAAHFAD